MVSFLFASMGRPVDDSEREFWLKVLDHRAPRFAKFVAMRAPSYVLAHDLMLLVRAVAGLYPDAYGQVMGEEAQRFARREMSRCIFCGDATGRPECWCEKCEADAVAEAEYDK